MTEYFGYWKNDHFPAFRLPRPVTDNIVVKWEENVQTSREFRDDHEIVHTTILVPLLLA